MKKRLVALLIALMMVLQLMPATVLSEGETVESTPVETVATVETPAASQEAPAPKSEQPAAPAAPEKQ